MQHHFNAYLKQLNILITDKSFPGGILFDLITIYAYDFKEIKLDLNTFFFRVRAFIFYLIVNDDDSNVAL